MNSKNVLHSLFPARIATGIRKFARPAIIAAVAFVLGGLLLGNGDKSAAGDGGATVADAPSEPMVWTCSMHPQIQLPKPGQCPICAMDLIPLEPGAGDDGSLRRLEMSETAKQLARIQTTPAVREFAEAEIRMVGRIDYDETRLADITARMPGRLDRLFADYTGMTVGAGDHIADIYSPDLLAAQEELVQASRSAVSLDGTRSGALQSTAAATLRAAREKLRLYGLTPEQIETVERTGRVADHLTLYAPIGGVIVEKDVKEGAYVSTGSRIYTIADLTRLWVLFEAYESDLPWLRYGQHVEFTSPSFPGKTFDAIVSFIAPRVDPATRTVRVRAIVDNSDRSLKPDMFVRGVVKSTLGSGGKIIDDYLAGKWISPMHPEIVKDGPGSCDVCGMDLVPAESLGYTTTASARADAPLLIPASAPLITGKRAVVYVEVADEHGPAYEGREVVLGPRAGEHYVVISGIEEGERVVTNGAFKIDSEMQIQAKPSMMSAAVGASAGRGGSERDPRGPAEGVSAAGRRALAPVYETYFELQMALARDDLPGARKAGTALKAAVDGIDPSAFSRSGHRIWMDHAEVLSREAQRAGTATSIEAARDAFFHVSKTVITLQERFGHTGEDFYLTFCPMARDGDGAYWLQKEDVVWNSFWGSKMLRCGSIEEKLGAASGGEN